MKIDFPYLSAKVHIFYNIIKKIEEQVTQMSQISHRTEGTGQRPAHQMR